MLVYSVTATVDIAIAGYIAGYSSIVVLEICLPPNTEAAPQTYNPGYVPAPQPCADTHTHTHTHVQTVVWLRVEQWTY